MNKRTLQIMAVILFITAFFYVPVLSNGFINWDDPYILLNNPRIRHFDAAHLLRLFTEMPKENVQPFIPLTYLSFAVEYRFFGLNPCYYHLNNLLLHLAVVGLIFLLGRKLGLSEFAAGTGALVFGIHPMHVESVAWVTERKDVLYSFFYLLAVIDYLGYLKKERRIYYWRSLFWGLLSILSKPMAASLPVILLIIDWFHKKSFNRRLLLNKIPFLLYIVPIGWLTYTIWMRNPIENIFQSGLIWVWCLTFYLKKFFLPITLLPRYVIPQPVTLGNPEYVTAFLILFLMLFLVYKERRNRLFLFANLFYFGSVFFLLRYDDPNRIGNFSPVADRFMYLPSLGYCLLLGQLLYNLIIKTKEKKKQRLIITGTVLFCILALGSKTYLQTYVWRDQLSLWNHQIEYAPDDYMALNNRANEFLKRKQYDRAKNDYLKVMALRPDDEESYLNLGNFYCKTRKFQQALAEVNKALERNPRLVKAWVNRSVIKFKMNDYGQALADIRRALELEPRHVPANNFQGLILDKMGKKEQAQESFQRALTIDPYNADAYYYWGMLLKSMQENEQAEEYLNKAALYNKKYKRP